MECAIDSSRKLSFTVAISATGQWGLVAKCINHFVRAVCRVDKVRLLQCANHIAVAQRTGSPRLTIAVTMPDSANFCDEFLIDGVARRFPLMPRYFAHHPSASA